MTLEEQYERGVLEMKGYDMDARDRRLGFAGEGYVNPD